MKNNFKRTFLAAAFAAGLLVNQMGCTSPDENTQTPTVPTIPEPTQPEPTKPTLVVEKVPDIDFTAIELANPTMDITALMILQLKQLANQCEIMQNNIDILSPTRVTGGHVDNLYN